MSNTVITTTIKRHLKVRKPDSLSDLDAVKERIFRARGASFPGLQSVETIANDLASPEFRNLASKLAQSFLDGRRILVMGKASSEIILSLACFKRGIGLLSQAMRRTRDVVTTTRGDLGAWRAEPDVRVLLGSIESGCAELVKSEIDRSAPDLIVLLSPPKGIAREVKNQIDALGHHIELATVSANSDCVDDTPDCLAFVPYWDKGNGEPPKRYTLCCILHFLLLCVRDEIAQSISAHPRSQALVAQLQSSGLDTNGAFVGLSILLDDMPLSAPMRLLVRSGLEQINRGWSLPSRTAHSRGLMSYGLRALLTECGAEYPFTSKELDVCLSPLFRVMAQTEDCQTLVDCLLTSDRKVAKDKSAKAALLVEQLDVLGSHAGSTVHPVLNRESRDLIELKKKQFQLRSERNDSLSEALLAVVVEQNCRQFGGVCMLIASNPDRPTRTLCHIRSQDVHLGDALIAMSFKSKLMSYNPIWQADTLFAHIELDESGVSAFESALRVYLDSAKGEFPFAVGREESDGLLNRNQRVFPLAHWVERQPWGKGFPEPVFEQDFRVCKVLTHMDSHQHIVVDDAADDVLGGEGFVLVWRNSVSSSVPTIASGQVIRVRYNLVADREKSSNDIFGLVDALFEIGDQ
ncbi:MAG: hypothetical protein RIK85_17650 [Marinobacter sp.]